MKRNQFGVNLDQGIPLLTKIEFEKLHVDCFNNTTEKLCTWIKEDNKPLFIGGQIGSGKSTLIEKSFSDVSQRPDITLHFDRESINLDTGDFWGIILSGFIQAALKQKADLSFCKLPQELGGYEPGDWKALFNALSPKEYSMSSFDTKIALRKTIAEKDRYIKEIVSEIGKRLETALGEKPLFIFASGLDKFEPGSPAFIAVQEIIPVLNRFKILYEVNAVHLFSKSSLPFSHGERLFIPTAEHDSVCEMLSKRMGNYAKAILKEIDLLAWWSGGNPRQALRLLTHFETSRKNRKWNRAECIAFAIRETAKDSFAYSPKPSVELMKTIKHSGKIETSYFSLPNDRETARKALYGNWILIKEVSNDISLPASVNPLVKEAFDVSVTPEEPEIKLLNEYAVASGISELGLDLYRLDQETGEEKSGDQLLLEFLASGVEHPISTNLSEIFDVLRGALLSKDRADRVIIAYKDQKIAEAARHYLFAKANTYEYQRYRHFAFEGGSGRKPLEKIEGILSKDIDIVSLEFVGKWEKTQLEALDKQRDRLLDFQMLWWIPYEELKKYLPYWIHLRQLFEIFILEDELLGSISTEEVTEDLSFFEELAVDENNAYAEVIKNLKVVLDYLKNIRKE